MFLSLWAGNFSNYGVAVLSANTTVIVQHSFHRETRSFMFTIYINFNDISQFGDGFANCKSRRFNWCFSAFHRIDAEGPVVMGETVERTEERTPLKTVNFNRPAHGDPDCDDVERTTVKRASYTPEELQRSYQNGFDDFLNKLMVARRDDGDVDLGICDEIVLKYNKLFESKEYADLGRKDARKHFDNLVLAQHNPGHSVWPHSGVIRPLNDEEILNQNSLQDYLERARRSGRRPDFSTVRPVRPGDYFIVNGDTEHIAPLDWTSEYNRYLPLLDGEVVIFLGNVDNEDWHSHQAMTGDQYQQQLSDCTFYLVQACGGRLGLVSQLWLTTPWFAKGDKYPNCFKKGLPPLFGDVKFPDNLLLPSPPPLTSGSARSRSASPQKPTCQARRTRRQSSAQPGPKCNPKHPTDMDDSEEDDEIASTHRYVNELHMKGMKPLDAALVEETSRFDTGKLASAILETYPQRNLEPERQRARHRLQSLRTSRKTELPSGCAEMRDKPNKK